MNSDLPMVQEGSVSFLGTFLPASITGLQDAFLAQVKHQVLSNLIYSFTNSHGKKIYDLTLPAIEMMMLARGNFEIKMMDCKPIGNDWVAKIIIHDKLRNMDSPGAAKQSKNFDKVEKTAEGIVDKPNKFAYAMALSKAYRNACKRLIPEPVKQLFIQMCVKQLTGQDVGQVEVSEPSSAVAELAETYIDDTEADPSFWE